MIKSLSSLKKPEIERLLFAGILFAIFSFVGSLPDIYYRYFDNTQYLTITQPVSIDKKNYAPCEKVVLTTKLTSQVDLNARSLVQLILIKDDGTNSGVGRILQGEVPILARKEHIVSGALQLPCDLSTGRYYWQGTATYSIRGYEKTYSFISDTFNVSVSGLTPGGDILQQQIDELK